MQSPNFASIGPGSLRVRPIHSLDVVAMSPGDEGCPAPGQIEVDQLKGFIRVRADEVDVILDKLKRVSANDRAFADAATGTTQ